MLLCECVNLVLFFITQNITQSKTKLQFFFPFDIYQIRLDLYLVEETVLVEIYFGFLLKNESFSSEYGTKNTLAA